MTTPRRNIKPLALVGGAVLAALCASLVVGRFCKPQVKKPSRAAINEWEGEGGNVEQPPISVGS